MKPSEIRPGARFRACGTVVKVMLDGRWFVRFDGDDTIRSLSHKPMEIILLDSTPKFTRSQRSLIRERLEAGDLADMLDSLTE